MPVRLDESEIMETFNHPICDAHSRVSRNVRIRAQYLARSGAVPGMDADDIAQHLRLHLLKRDGRFDPSRALYDTFADRLLYNCIASLAHPTQRLCAERLWIDFDTLVLDAKCDEALPLSETLPESAALYAAPTRLPDETMDIRLDIQRMLATLNLNSQSIAGALIDLTPTEVAQELGIHRSTVYAHMKIIRKAATDLGIDAYLARPRQIRASAGM